MTKFYGVIKMAYERFIYCNRTQRPFFISSWFIWFWWNCLYLDVV